MKFVKIEDVRIPPGRTRREFPKKDHDELVESILSIGLLAPIILRADGITILAGERRYMALKEIFKSLTWKYGDVTFDGVALNHGEIPSVTVTEQDATTYLEAELHENIKRKQLTWQEQVIGEKALHDLRKAQNPKQTVSTTARELGQPTHVGEISQDLVLAEHMDDEDVAKAPSRTEALKVLEKKLERGYRAGLAKQFTSLQDTSGQVIQGDLRDLMPKLPEAVFSVIIADLPYGIDADSFGNQKAVKHDYVDSAKASDDLYQTVAFEGFRVTTRAAHLYLFCDIRRFAAIRDMVEPCGWKVWQWPIIWFRGVNIGIVPWPKTGPRRTYEAILYAVKGERPVNLIGPDVLSIQHDGTVERAAHKPSALYEALLARSVLPGDRVLDPCCGTGPVFPAARATKSLATGFEIDPVAFTQATERMKV